MAGINNWRIEPDCNSDLWPGSQLPHTDTAALPWTSHTPSHTPDPNSREESPTGCISEIKIGHLYLLLLLLSLLGVERPRTRRRLRDCKARWTKMGGEGGGGSPSLSSCWKKKLKLDNSVFLQVSSCSSVLESLLCNREVVGLNPPGCWTFLLFSILSGVRP